MAPIEVLSKRVSFMIIISFSSGWKHFFKNQLYIKPHFTQITNRMFQEDYPSLPLSKEGDASLLHLPSAITIALELCKMFLLCFGSQSEDAAWQRS